MIALALNNIRKFYGATKVLEDISFEVQEGEKAGIVGKNGSGKSTLLKLIMGLEGEYSGGINIKKSAALGYVDQLPSFEDDVTVNDVLNDAFKVQYSILKDIRSLELSMAELKDKQLEAALNKYQSLQQKYESLGGYEIEEKLSKISTGLNFSDEFIHRNFNSLSGGEKTTVLLGKVLLQSPDILLLDEPSNHLDIKSIEWLEEFISNYKGTVLIVSHDRYFLDKTVTKIIEIEDMKSKVYPGSYSKYIELKETALALQLQSYEDQQKKINQMEEAVKRFRNWAAIANNEKMYKKAFNMEKRIDKMEKVDKPKLKDDKLKLNLSLGQRSGKDVIFLENACKAFGRKTILNNAALDFKYGEKLALLGDNGCGKSTLIKIILNCLNENSPESDYILDSGTIKLGSSIKLGYMPQEITFKNEDCTVLECFREDITYPEGKAREYLAKFLFYGETVYKKVKGLSGGERSRLLLSKLLFNEINLLILDEPTNHLDIPSRKALEETLLQFEGSIFFVSHDRYFINTLCDKIVELNEGKLTGYEGNYEYYKEKKKEKADLEIPVKKNKSEKKEPVKAQDKTKNNNKKSEARSLLLEKEINSLEAEIRELDEAMSITTEYKELNELFSKKEELSKNLETYMEEWLELS